MTRSLVGQNFGQAHHDHKGFVFCFLGEGNPSAQEFNMLSRRSRDSSFLRHGQLI